VRQVPQILLFLAAMFGAVATPRLSGAAPPAKKTAAKAAKVSAHVKTGARTGAKPAAKKATTKATTKATRKTPQHTTKKTAGRTAKKAAPKKAVFLEQHAAAVKGNQPNVLSLGALIVDLGSKQELFSRRPDSPRAIASISKLAAALVVSERNIPLDELTTMKRVDIEVARGGAPSRLPEGMTLSNRDLLHAALLGSDNRAVSALGRAVGLNTAEFTNAMNRKVAALGLHATHFREPTGLSPENVSTPREVLGMLAAAMADPLLGPIVRRHEYDAHPVGRPPIRYISTHRPAARANVQVLGGKTGFNDPARYCLVIAVRVDGHDYGMALLGTEGKLTRFGDVARVADWIVAHPVKHLATAPQASPPAPTAEQGPPLPAALAPDGSAPQEQLARRSSPPP
jgi:D-alanyl-D-alanine endopeptidase (penicillin-binding protein 7)